MFARGLSGGQALSAAASNNDKTLPSKNSQRRHENLMNFLISLDFLVKGLLSHWQIRLSEQPAVRGKSTAMMKGLDIKFPILIGD
jgi:hypothetical protein